MTTPTTQPRPLAALPIIPTFLQEEQRSPQSPKNHINTMQITQIAEGNSGTILVDTTDGRKNVPLANTAANDRILAKVFNIVI